MSSINNITLIFWCVEYNHVTAIVSEVLTDGVYLNPAYILLAYNIR